MQGFQASFVMCYATLPTEINRSQFPVPQTFWIKAYQQGVWVYLHGIPAKYIVSHQKIPSIPHLLTISLR